MPATPPPDYFCMDVPSHTVGEVIGLGGMATVYRAEHVLLRQNRALKALSPELVQTPGV